MEYEPTPKDKREPMPGELLLEAIHSLPDDLKDKLNYTGVCSLIAEEIAAHAIRSSIHDLERHSGELSE